MRIMLDTNVLISLLLFPSERMNRMMEYISSSHTLVLSSFIVNELKAVTAEKFPYKAETVDRFLAKASFEYVYTPEEIPKGLFEIRDEDDYPVLYSAITEEIDILITGDHDFTEVDVEHPRICTPSEFMNHYENNTDYSIEKGEEDSK